jgi:hypothetical protein
MFVSIGSQLADECFGFGEFGAGQPNRTGVELQSRDSRGFVRLGVRSKSNTRRHGADSRPPVSDSSQRRQSLPTTLQRGLDPERRCGPGQVTDEAKDRRPWPVGSREPNNCRFRAARDRRRACHALHSNDVKRNVSSLFRTCTPTSQFPAGRWPLNPPILRAPSVEFYSESEHRNGPSRDRPQRT